MTQLHGAEPTGDSWWFVIVYVSDSVGFGVATVLALHCGQSRLVRRRYGPPPPAPRRPPLFWTVAAAVVAAGVATLPLHPVGGFATDALRLMLAAGLALFAGAAAVRVADNLSRADGGGHRAGAHRDVVGAA